MRLVWQFLAVMAITVVCSVATKAVDGHPWPTLALGLLTAVLTVLVYGWVVRRTEHRAVTETAREGAVPAILRGLVIGLVWFGAVIANIAFLGGYHVHGIDSPSGAAGLFGFMAAAAVTEEVLYRGVLFRIVEERWGTWIALALTGLLFGGVHLLNPNASAWGAVAIAVEAGGALAAAYAATRNLWVPIGLHFGWNFAAAGIFGTEVSGNDTPPGLLDATTSGSPLVTGGDFGPEGSVYAVVFGALVTIAFLWLARRRGTLVPLGGRRSGRLADVATLPR
ncbi:CPBP family intramembrane glutamic endopeptidase [Streptomyces tagetis]|uniref:CPBP family intramembrane metalloprotease n=1 Tax=Streptomyces tagetis TaxID=2820809 RepID=A0A941B1S9_9ACTN|nr:type II CAAX endopeptidase family protein [Streptomyces sp. RG38]MBQ0826467.1 CPBP family intramembrane metalloprotease [Streptomyces sp. RG38]